MKYYFINYEKSIVAIGECNPSYMQDRGYTEVTKEVYEDYIHNNAEYLAKLESFNKEIEELEEQDAVEERDE